MTTLVFWQSIVAADALAVGYTTISLHWLFVVLQLFAAAGSSNGIGAVLATGESPCSP